MSNQLAAVAKELDFSRQHAYRLQPWIVCFTAALFFFYIFIQLNMFNALNPHLIASFHLSAVQLGHLSAEYFYADVLFLFPAGMILDRFSTRWVLAINMALALILTFTFALSHSLWELNLSRFVMGLVGAFCLISCVRLASRWFPPRRMALVVGLVVTFAMFGGMVAQTPFAILTDHFGWRKAMLLDGVIGVVILVLIISLVRDFPIQYRAANLAAHHPLKEIGWKKAILMTLRNTQNWLAGFYASLLNLPIFLFGAMWGSMYLMQTHNLSRDQSTSVTMMLFVGVIVGSPVAGWVSDRIGRRRLPMIIGAALSIAIMLMIMFIQHLSLLELMLLFVLLGVTTSTQIIAYPLIAESNPASLTASAEGMASVLIMAGGFTQTLFAKALMWHWSHRYIHHIPFYSHFNYLIALSIMPVAMLVALLASIALRETRCVNHL